MNFFHKKLIVSGLCLLTMTALGQSGKYFCPANFENWHISVPPDPNSNNPLADGEFSFDCQIWLDSIHRERPIFSKYNAEDPRFLSFAVTADHRLAFHYHTSKIDPETFEITEVINSAVSDPDVIEPGKWVEVAMAHAGSRTCFWVDGQLVLVYRAPASNLGKTLIDHGPWMFGSVSAVEDGPATILRGRLDDVRLWQGDMADFYGTNVGGRSISAEQRVRSIFVFDMESFKTGADPNDQILENRSASDVRFLNGELMKVPQGQKPSRFKPEKYRDTSGLPGAGDVIALITVFFIVLFMGFVIWWVSKAAPGVTYYSNKLPPGTALTEQPAPEFALPEKIPELPIEFGQLWPGERLEFVVQTGSPLPWSRLILIAGQMGFGLVVTREIWKSAFSKILSENESEQIVGLVQVIFTSIGLGLFLWFFNQKHWPEVMHLFRGKRTVVGTSERLILGEPNGANRTIFWEQIRTTTLDTVTADLKFELRTGPKPIESPIAEVFWLTGIANSREIHARLQELIAARPILNSGENDLSFHQGMTLGGPEAWFGPVEVHQKVVFSARDFFGKNQLLMLRSRIKKAIVEPYDIPKPGWAVVLFLENGVRFPLFFTDDLAEAKKAAGCF